MIRLTDHLAGERRKKTYGQKNKVSVHVTEKLLVLLAKFGNKIENLAQEKKQRVHPLPPSRG